MQTVANIAKRLDMSAEKAVEMLRSMFFKVDGVDSQITDEEADLLIDVDEDPSRAEAIRNARLKELHNVEEAGRRAQTQVSRIPEDSPRVELVCQGTQRLHQEGWIA